MAREDPSAGTSPSRNRNLAAWSEDEDDNEEELNAPPKRPSRFFGISFISFIRSTANNC